MKNNVLHSNFFGMKQFILGFFALANASLVAQNTLILFVDVPHEQKVEVHINDALFTSFLYADSLTKQVLYPIYTASGKSITGGYPIHPQPGESTDHPHQVGSWLNFGEIEGLDFGNHSFAIPESEQRKYGTPTCTLAVNNLGGRAFDEKSEPVNFILKEGETITLIYKVLIKNRSFISEEKINNEMF